MVYSRVGQPIKSNISIVKMLSQIPSSDIVKLENANLNTQKITADSVPMIIYDLIKVGVVCAVHLGRKDVLDNLTEKILSF